MRYVVTLNSFTSDKFMQLKEVAANLQNCCDRQNHHNMAFFFRNADTYNPACVIVDNVCNGVIHEKCTIYEDGTMIMDTFSDHKLVMGQIVTLHMAEIVGGSVTIEGRVARICHLNMVRKNDHGQVFFAITE